MNSKPIIKWVGGKTQIIDKIMENFPIEINNYHELFLGGGSVLLALLSFQTDNKIKINGSINAYDINETLINMYINVRDRPRKIIAYMNKILKIFNNINEEKGPRNIKHKIYIKSKESFYYWIRYKFNKYSQDKKNSYKGSTIFIFLNKTCFRGLYREGPNGFNVPYGHYNNPEIINKEHLMNISKLIKNVNFIHSDFSKSFNNINNQDYNNFFYLDPPYAPINNTSFVDYNADGFDINKHKKLFELIKNMANKNIKFMMSNADVPMVREEFIEDIFNIMTILCKRSINSKNPESKVNEVIIKNY